MFSLLFYKQIFSWASKNNFSCYFESAAVVCFSLHMLWLVNFLKVNAALHMGPDKERGTSLLLWHRKFVKLNVCVFAHVQQISIILISQ